jgi:uncharacterized protein (TIGR02466 family)|tara:strand:+ start:489 stop:1103 length:615 start_codon:yes stop_codon:yes gene_type:complete
MPELPLTEYYSLFPNLITRQDISGYAEQDEVIHELLHGTDTGEHNLLNKAKTSHSRDFLDNYPDLKKRIQNAVNQYSTKTGLEQSEITHSWYGVYDEGGSITRHMHRSSIISGAYYPYIEKGFTEICFENPTATLNSIWPIVDPSEWNVEGKAIGVKQGMLVLFPSWMYHYTTANTSGTRCVVSFNTYVHPFDMSERSIKQKEK